MGKNAKLVLNREENAEHFRKRPRREQHDQFTFKYKNGLKNGEYIDIWGNCLGKKDGERAEGEMKVHTQTGEWKVQRFVAAKTIFLSVVPRLFTIKFETE